MKKIVVFLVLCSLFVFPLTVKAQTNFYMSDEDIEELDQIKENESNLIAEANQTMFGEEPVKSDEIDYSAAIKIRMGVDIFNNDKLTKDDLDEAVKGADFAWIIPVFSNGRTIQLTIAKGAPVEDDVRSILTSEEIEKLEDKVGKWTVYQASVSNEELNYHTILNNIAINNQLEDVSIYILGGILGYQDGLAIFAPNKGDCLIVPITEAIEFYNSPDEINKEELVHTFNNIKTEINQSQPKEDEMGGKPSASEENPATIRLVALIVIPICVVVIGLTIWNKKWKKGDMNK